MKEQIEVLSRLAHLRGTRVQQVQARMAYQKNLCQRYRNNIAGLGRLCTFTVPATTPLQRSNQSEYKMALHKMVELQKRELAVAEQTLERIQAELFEAMRSEKVVQHVMDHKIAQWNQMLAQQEQKIQDALASQSWWRAAGSERPI